MHMAVHAMHVPLQVVKGHAGSAAGRSRSCWGLSQVVPVRASLHMVMECHAGLWADCLEWVPPTCGSSW